MPHGEEAVVKLGCPRLRGMPAIQIAPAPEPMRYAGQMSSSPGSGKRARIGKWLVGIAVLVPALLVVSLYLYLQGNLVGHRVHGPLWPWITADAAVLALGMLLLRGQEL